MALQHDLPIFVSIDGSLDKHGIATTSICILAPDIWDEDEIDGMNWQNRLAKVLLIRSWRLPKYWGTSPVCINMAEAIGFILGEYTIPSNLPILYITDSNNARSLQRKIRNKEEFTHRTYIRNIKQGIDSSIASHLEYLTSRWPREETLSDYTRRLYHRGEELCKYWALPNKDKTRIGLNNFGDLERVQEQYNDDLTDTSSSSSHSSTISKLVRDTENTY